MDKEEKQYIIRFLTVQIKKKAYFLIEQSSKSSKFPKSPKSCQHQNVKYLPLKGRVWGGLNFCFSFCILKIWLNQSQFSQKESAKLRFHSSLRPDKLQKQGALSEFLTWVLVFKLWLNRFTFAVILKYFQLR